MLNMYKYEENKLGRFSYAYVSVHVYVDTDFDDSMTSTPNGSRYACIGVFKETISLFAFV